MAAYTGTVTSPRPIEDVFDYLADFSNVDDWDPSAIEAEALNGAEPHRGARYRVVSRFLGREIPLVYEIVEFEPPDRVLLRAESGGVVSLDEMRFRALTDGDTEVTYTANLSLKGARSLLDPLFGIAFRRLCERARERMSEVLA